MNILRIVKTNYIIIVILIFSAIILSININKPFIGHHDWNGVTHSNQARNFIKYGYFQTKFAAVQNVGIVEKEEFGYSTHYPPALPILISLSFHIFGISEFSARLVPLLFSLFTIFLVYKIGLKFFDKSIAVLAGIFSAIFPMMIYYGNMPVHDILVVAPILFSIFLYFNYLTNSTNKNLLLLIAALVFAHIINWPAYYLTPIIAFHYYFFSKSKKKLKVSLIFISVSLIMFMTHMIHTWLTTGNLLGGGLEKIFISRINLTNVPAGYSTKAFLITQARWMAIYYTRPILILSATTMLWIFYKLFGRQFDKRAQLIIILLILGVMHNVIFRNAAFYHDYLLFYLVPFFAISSGFGLHLILKKIKLKPPLTIFIIFIVAIIVLAERSQYLSTLLSTSGKSDAMIIGKIINSRTRVSEETLILSPQFRYHFEATTAYYADRTLNYFIPESQDLSNSELSSKYKLIIAVPGRDTPMELINNLNRYYNSEKIGNFIVYSEK